MELYVNNKKHCKNQLINKIIYICGYKKTINNYHTVQNIYQVNIKILQSLRLNLMNKKPKIIF